MFARVMCVHVTRLLGRDSHVNVHALALRCASPGEAGATTLRLAGEIRQNG